jgi:hypothetical protein
MPEVEMRVALLALPLLMAASPAVAQSAQPQQRQLQVPREFSDPAMAERLARMTEVLGKALLNLPAGELEAIAQGRQPTEADRRRTVRDTARAGDPNFERDFQQQMAQSRPIIESSMKAMVTALPSIMQSLEKAGEALERATANMPSPTYPKR